MRCTNPLCGWTGFNTQPPEGGWERDLWKPIVPVPVSTHSRLKAAGRLVFFTSQHSHRFNTQPPEGGWRQSNAGRFPQSCFNTQPPEGGWSERDRSGDLSVVSTHSRLKAAGIQAATVPRAVSVSTHSRLKAAGFCCSLSCCSKLFQHTAA